MTAANDNGFKLAYSPEEAAEAMSLGLTTIYAMMNDGRLRRIKVGRRTLIPRSSLEAVFDQAGDAA